MSEQHRLVARSNTQTKLSPQLKARLRSKAHSDSEGSGESNSLSAESCNVKTVKDIKSSKRNSRRGSEWEILEGLREGQRYEVKPSVFTGYLLKKRKWPLKGWHKRYFVIDKGILVYARSASDIARGKIHGSVDIGLSVISTKSKSKRIDIDAEEFIYHLKAKRVDHFTKWLEQLRQHRLYRQHLLTFGSAPRSSAAEGLPHVVEHAAGYAGTPVEMSPSKENSLKRQLLNSPPGPRLGLLLDSSTNLDCLGKDLKQIGHSVAQLQSILDQVSSLSFQSDSEVPDNLSSHGKKDRRRFGIKKKKSSGKNSGSSIELASSYQSDTNDRDHLSSSQTCLSASGLSGLAASRPHSVGLPYSDFLSPPDLQLRQDFMLLAKDVVSNVKSCLTRLCTERDRLKTVCVGLETSAAADHGPQNVVSSLKQALNQALHQNKELRNRLNRVHDIADLADISSKQLVTNLSYSSSCVSEFFDAECDQLAVDQDGIVNQEKRVSNEQSDSSSDDNNSLTSEEEEEEEEEEGASVSSDNSELADNYAPVTRSGVGRRTKLPAIRPTDEGFSLWNILCKNIGKDLSQISMPVALNEPLNMLQRLCEELEYSELLDKAAELDDPVERMVHVAAFAVSSYGSSYFRAGSKPFNPLLGETYECIREDKGFRFVSEQVSHHPPISVCHAESRHFTFWQDVRIKTKFWGKSMEFQPAGTVNLHLLKFNEQYAWNKVTTCVHNLFSGQRWVDQYGELNIKSSSSITCKLTFVKASYWSAKRHEVHGVVINEEGKIVRNLFGKWSEAIYCGVAPSAKCIWRPGTMPEDYELYYGFTRFAIELNELDDELTKWLPPTDTRFRPDQRLLEEGDLEGAERMKQLLEQNQRERRRRQELGEVPAHVVRWFDHQRSGDDESWKFNHNYWELRQSLGFAALEFQPLW